MDGSASTDLAALCLSIIVPVTFMSYALTKPAYHAFVDLHGIKPRVGPHQQSTKRYSMGLGLDKAGRSIFDSSAIRH